MPVVTQTTRRVLDSQGRPIPLGRELARGGEGGVVEIADRPDLVAKLYHRPLDAEHAAKLDAMVGLRSDRLLGLTAWPVETLRDGPRGAVIGFLMPKVSGFKAIHTLYSPKNRLTEFPNAGWPFLIHAASNLARAFAVVHEHGHIVGDVNHANALVSHEATVKLIDCDSFQIAAHGRRYLCEVGVPTHTPPELQGRPFRGVVRTPNHDAFGLAVLIFQLLCLGRHPFSGGFLGVGEMPLERAIRECRFAYSSRSALLQMRPPPGTPALAALSEPVGALFERAFSQDGMREGGRPRPQDWASTLASLAGSLKRCGRSGHHYLQTLPACPWCDIETRSGVLLFNLVLVGARQVSGAFDVDAIWAQIAAIQRPGAPPPIPGAASSRAQPSAKAVVQGRRRRKRRDAAFGAVMLVVTGALILHANVAVASFVIVLTIVAGVGFVGAEARDARYAADKALREANQRLQSAQERWQKHAGADAFDAKLRSLAAAKQQFRTLEAVRQEKLHRLEAARRERQLQKFLDGQRIDRAQISGIGPSRVTMLQSYGIETAADVAPAAILAIPGFGPTFTQRLLDWRRSVERRFVFNPAQGVDPADIAAVEREIAARRAQFEAELRGGPDALRQIARQVAVARETLRPALEQAGAAVAQAEADRRAL